MGIVRARNFEAWSIGVTFHTLRWTASIVIAEGTCEQAAHVTIVDSR